VRRTGGLQSQPLYPARVLAVMRREHRLAGRNALAVTGLVGIPLLLLGRDLQSREIFDETCQAAHFEPSIRLESRSPASLVALAEAGHGVAIVPPAVRLDASRVAIAGMLDGARPLGSWSDAVWDSRRYLPTFAPVLSKCSRITPKPRTPATSWAISPAPCCALQHRDVSPHTVRTEFQIRSSLTRYGRTLSKSSAR